MRNDEEGSLKTRRKRGKGREQNPQCDPAAHLETYCAICHSRRWSFGRFMLWVITGRRPENFNYEFSVELGCSTIDGVVLMLTRYSRSDFRKVGS